MYTKGEKQGNMNPEVKDYQKPMKDYSQAGFNMTTEYVARQDKFQGKEAGEIRTQAYQGRYS